MTARALASGVPSPAEYRYILIQLRALASTMKQMAPSKVQARTLSEWSISVSIAVDALEEVFSKGFSMKATATAQV